MNFLLSKTVFKLKHVIVNRLVTLSISKNNGVSFSKVPLQHSSSPKSEVLPVLYNHMPLRFARFASAKRQAKRKPDNRSVIPQTKEKAGEISVGNKGMKVKQAVKDATYGIIAFGGLCITGGIIYAISRELLSSQRLIGVYSMAYKDCLKSTEITDVFGEPLKFYGEMTKSGKRRYVSHTEYEVDGVKYMKMKSKSEGPSSKGTVNLDIQFKQSSSMQSEENFFLHKDLVTNIAWYIMRPSILQSHSEYEADGVKYMKMKFYIEGPLKKGTVNLEVKEIESDKYEYRYLFVELADYPHRKIILQDNR